MKWIFLGLTALLFVQPAPRKQWRNPEVTPLHWNQLAPGLDFTQAEASILCNIGDSRISILRIDPKDFDFHVLSSQDFQHENLTAPAWAKEHQLIAVINAGMYQTDFVTHVGYMQQKGKINNGQYSSDNSIAAFHPKNTILPPFQIIDRQCQDWKSLTEEYQSLVQCIRMVDCQQKNRWSQQAKYWSMSVLGADRSGRMLMIFCRTPYSVHDMIDMLLVMPIDLHNAMYLEGGPEASFYLASGQTEVRGIGSYETGFYESDANAEYWPLPNVIGISPKK